MRLFAFSAFIVVAACGASQAPLTTPLTAPPTTAPEKDQQAQPTPVEVRGKDPADPPPAQAQPPPPPQSASLDPPPWGGAPLPRKLVPKVYLVEHAKAENRGDCPLLVATELGEAPQAKPRKATFHGGWAVAYDQKGLPGTAPSGADCDTCGRSAFGVAGTGTGKSGGPAWPKELLWSDGSRAGYGPPGGAEGDGKGGRLLAYLEISDAKCLYNVWSALGEEHLVTVIRGLRRVEP